MVVKLTHEQLRIVNHNVQPGEVIKIIAFAGQSLNFTNFLNVNLTKKKEIIISKCVLPNVFPIIGISFIVQYPLNYFLI